MDSDLAKAISRLAESHERGCGAIAKSLDNIAVQIKYLGNGDAATHMGAIENLAKGLHEGTSAIAEGLRMIAESDLEN